MRLALACLLAGSTLLVACTVGPDYHGPPPAPDGTRSFARAAGVPEAVGLPLEPLPGRWWTGLGDAELDRLEAAALAQNADLAAALARLRESRAQLHAQQAGLLPTTDASAFYLHTHGGTGLLGGDNGAASPALLGGISDDLDLYDVGFDASWEIDLFGSKRRAIEGAAASARARAADLADAQVSVTADVAQAYVSLRDLQRRTILLRESAGLQGRGLALTRRRETGGTASALDVERLNTQVQQTLSDLVPLRAQIAAELDRLATLTGRAPGALDPELVSPSPLPLPPARVAIGDPAALLRRRPDIRAAERRIASANAAIGQHIADYFPKLELLGDLGFTSTQASQLFTGGSFTAVAAPVLQWQPLDFGRTQAAVAQARAGRDEAVASYRSTVLKALGDAEDSLARYAVQRDDVVALGRVLASADHAASLTRQRYAGGTASLIDLLDTERQRIEAQQAVAQAEAALTEDYVSLQKSLGLGWM